MRYACPVPKTSCAGAMEQVEPGGKVLGVHINVADVRRCFRKYMIRQGYEPGRNGEFHKDGHPTVMMSKTPGSPLRWGKEKSRHMHRTAPIIST